MAGYNPFDFNNSAFFKATEQFRRTVDAIKVPVAEINATAQVYREAIAPITATIQNINAVYAPVIEQTRKYEELYNDAIRAALQSSASVGQVIADLDLPTIQSIAESLRSPSLPESILNYIDSAAEMYNEGTITDEDIAEEFKKVVAKKEVSFNKKWSKEKKSKIAYVINLILPIILFFGSPVVDKVKENTLEVMGVTDYYEKSGIFEKIDELFGIDNKETVNKQEETEAVDIKENVIQSLNSKILTILLKDKTTGNNIIWATDNYSEYGEGYGHDDFITTESITGENGNIIKPRTEKSKEEQSLRSREKAEVFTPSWVCNKQNNLVDNEWFGYENIFNIETDTGWITNTKKIIFPNTKGKTWQDYVKANRLEISCGEAPYLASRYDAVTGEYIPVAERIGLLDRKLRIVCENCGSEPEWVEWAVKAYQSIYGYEWQGDNVLLARENLFYTFIDYYSYKFSHHPIIEYLMKIANIIAWNIWQMDGIRGVVPNTCHKVEIPLQITLFGDEEITVAECPGCAKNDIFAHNGIQCRIYDWTNLKKSVPYTSLYKGGRK